MKNNLKGNNLNVLKQGYLPWRPYNWISNFKQFFRNIKYAHQRIVKGYCDRDVWGLDAYYSDLFYYTLNQLAKEVHGYPGYGLFEDEQAKKDGYKDAFDRWQKYLKEIAEHFLNTQEWNENIPINQECEKLSDEMNSYILETHFEKCKDDPNFSIMVNTFSDENAYNAAKEKWLEKEKEAVEFRNREKDIAFDMMKEYFFHL